MCMEDVKIGKAAICTETVVAVGAASGLLIAAAPTAFSLLISPPSAGTITISTINPAVLGAGFNLAAGQPMLRLNVEQDGNCVSKAWFAIASAPTNISVMQSLMPLT